MKKTKDESKFLWRLLFAMLFITPLLYTNYTIDWIIPVRAVFTALIIVLTAAYVSRKKLSFPVSLLRNRSFQLLILYVLSGGFSYFSALNKNEFFAATSFKLLLPLLIVAIFTIFRNIENPENKVAIYIIYGSFVFSLLSLLQITFSILDFIPSSYLGSSTFANINMLTAAVILSFPFSIYGIYKLNLIPRIIAYCNVFTSAYVIAIHRTRSVWMAALLSVVTIFVILLVIRRKAGIKFWNKTTRNILILVIIAIITASAAYAIIDKYFPDAGSTVRNKKDVLGSSTVAVRLDVWKKSLELIKDHPLLGVGSGNWALNINSYGTQDMRSENGKFSYRRPHNDYVWIASENGIITLIVYLGFLLSIFLTGIKKLFINNEIHWENLIAIFGVETYGIIALFSFPGERIYNICMLALFSVIILRQNTEATDRPFEKYPWIIFQMLAVVFLGVSIARFQSDMYMRKIADTRKEIDQIKISKAQKRIPSHSADLKMNSLRTKITKYADRAYTPVYSIDPTSTHVLAFKAKMLFDMGKYRESLKEYQLALQENPYHLYTMFSTALTYERLNKSEEEMEMHEKILAIAPRFPGSLLELAAKSAFKGDTDKSYSYFDKVDKKINVVRYNTIAMMLTEQYIRKNNLELAGKVFGSIEGDVPVPKYKELKEILNTEK